MQATIIDGEVVVQREDGVADFHALRSALSAEPHRVVYFAFDLYTSTEGSPKTDAG